MGRDDDAGVYAIPPLVPPAIAMAAGVAVDRLADPCGTAAWALAAFAAGLIAAMAWAAGRRANWLGTPALLAGLATLGGAYHHARWSDLAPDDLARSVGPNGGEGPAWVRGVLVGVEGFRPGSRPDDPGLTRAKLAVSAVRDGDTWRPVSGRVLASIRGDRSDLPAGAPVMAAGRIEAVAGPRNPGEFSYRDYLRARGVRLTLAVDGPAGLWPDDEPGPPTWARTRARLEGEAREWSRATLARGLAAWPGAVPLAGALLLGRREAVDPETADAFARTATAHLLAISGLHLQLLALAVGKALRLAGVRSRSAWGTVALASVGYALLVGLVPSVVRSAAMTVAGCIAAIGFRQSRPANALALAAAFTLALNPAWLFDAGCQLSFLAVGAIAWGVPPAIALAGRLRRAGPLDRLEWQYAPRWKHWINRPIAWMGRALAVSAVVWFATLPLTVSTFHVVAPVGIALNLPLIPLTSAALLASGLTLVLTAAWPPLGMAAGQACGALLTASEWLVGWGAGLSWGHWFEPGPPGWAVAACYAALGLVLVAPRGRARAWAWGSAGLAAAVSTALAFSPHRPEGLEAEFLAVDHGLAVVIQGADGRAMLYDCGRLGDPGVGRRRVAPALWARRLRRLEAVVLSHADADHYSGLADLLDRFKIGAVLVPPGFASPANPEAGPLLDRARARGIPVRERTAGDGWAWPDAEFRVVHPPAGWGAGGSDNARSVVLEVASGGPRLLLTGDLEGDGLPEAAGKLGPGPVAAMLAPHHGGRASNPAWLYDRWRPGLVVSSQRATPSGSADALAAVEARGVPVWRTSERGAVLLRWLPGGIEARGYLDPPGAGY